MESRDVSAIQEALSGIIGAYERDFAKHPNISEFPKISMIWKSIPSQLARENKKFIYKVVKEGARAREYEDALQWLVDVGLLRRLAQLAPTAFGEGNRLFTEFKGAFQRENDVFPVEVKSEANTSGKSLKKFKELFPNKVKLRIRFSLDNLKLDNDVLNIPLFMADQKTD